MRLGQVLQFGQEGGDKPRIHIGDVFPKSHHMGADSSGTGQHIVDISDLTLLALSVLDLLKVD